jgi:GalNAc-alpha-(1->4)-GalNAc-alpha-(1->3)-diNAcBac-PP-undecaprenol alpha-1,4-N-acetyl-D-galactosaminyltransferase
MQLTLIIATLEAGGAERVLSIMANYWAKKGHQITIITLSVSETDFFYIHPDIRRIALDKMSISINPTQAILGNFQRVQRLRQAILASRPQAIISFIDKVNILTLLACIGVRIPVIISERTDPRHYSIGRIWSGLRRLLYPHSSALVVQSEAVRGWARGFLRDSMIHTIPNPVTPPTDAECQDSEWAALLPPGPIIAALGRLCAEKGFDLLLKAAAQVLKSHSDWTLIIIGEGMERENLERLAAGLDISHRVRFLGFVPEPMRLLPRADLFVLSSRFEGFPNALLEAMACGLPVISTDCSGARAIIRNGVDGILVPVEDEDALAAAMKHLISDEKERACLASRAPEVALRFGTDHVMGIWHELLTDVWKTKQIAG